METVLKTVGAVATPSPGVRIPRPPHQHQQGSEQGKRLRPVCAGRCPRLPATTVHGLSMGHARGTMGHAGGTMRLLANNLRRDRRRPSLLDSCRHWSLVGASDRSRCRTSLLYTGATEGDSALLLDDLSDGSRSLHALDPSEGVGPPEVCDSKGALVTIAHGPAKQPCSAFKRTMTGRDGCVATAAVLMLLVGCTPGSKPSTAAPELSTTAGNGPPVVATAQTAAPPLIDTQALPCGDSIDNRPPPRDWQVVRGVVALPASPRADALSTGLTGESFPALRLFAKTGLVIKTGVKFELVVTDLTGNRVGISWGDAPSTPSHRVVVNCPDNGGPAGLPTRAATGSTTQRASRCPFGSARRSSRSPSAWGHHARDNDRPRDPPTVRRGVAELNGRGRMPQPNRQLGNEFVRRSKRAARARSSCPLGLRCSLSAPSGDLRSGTQRARRSTWNLRSVLPPGVTCNLGRGAQLG